MIQNVDYERNLIKQCYHDYNKFLLCLERINAEYIFTDDICRLFWNVFSTIDRSDQTICESTVKDVLKLTGNEDIFPEFEQIISSTYIDEDQWEYQMAYLLENYQKKMLLELSKEINKGISTRSVKDLVKISNEFLREVSVSDVRSQTFKEAYRNEITNIRDIYDGKKNDQIITGMTRLDSILAISSCRLILLAAGKKIGKTRFMIHLIDQIINHNKDIAIQWFTLEMRAEEVIRGFLSKKVRLTDNELLGKSKLKIEPEKMADLEMAYKIFENYPIEFIDEPVTMFNISSKFERFCQKNHGKKCILVIDNLGLIKPHINDTLAYEDDLARMMKNLRDSTQGTIFALHHLTKETESKWNKETGYTPKLRDVRGSSRILDFSNQAILLHRPGFYKDLVEEARKIGKEQALKEAFEVIIDMNRHGDTGDILLKHEIQYCNFNE